MKRRKESKYFQCGVRAREKARSRSAAQLAVAADAGTPPAALRVSIGRVPAPLNGGSVRRAGHEVAARWYDRRLNESDRLSLRRVSLLLQFPRRKPNARPPRVL